MTFVSQQLLATRDCTVQQLETTVYAANEVLYQGVVALLLKVPEVALDHVLAERAPWHRLAERSFDLLIVACDGLELEAVEEIAHQAIGSGRKLLLVVRAARPGLLELVSSVPSDGLLVQDELTVASLRDAIRRIASGGHHVPNTIAAALLSRVRAERQEPSGAPARLTAREQDVVRLVAEGLSNREIGGRLHLSEHSAKKIVANLLAKLNCPNRTQLAALAVREGLVSA